MCNDQFCRSGAAVRYGLFLSGACAAATQVSLWVVLSGYWHRPAQSWPVVGAVR
jgi:hypothetical protein